MIVNQPSLPNEMLLLIFDKLAWKDVKTLRLVSKNVGELALRTLAWQRTRVTLTCANYREACLILRTKFSQVSEIKVLIPTRVRLTCLSRRFEMRDLLLSVPENIRKLVVQEAPAEKRLTNPPEMQICGLDPHWFATLVSQGRAPLI